MHIPAITTTLLALIGISHAAPATEPGFDNPVIFPIILDPVPVGTKAIAWTPWVRPGNLAGLSTRQIQFCHEYPDCQATDYNNAMKCADYLKSLGTRNCVVDGGQNHLTVMCQCGKSIIDGWPTGGASRASSYCGDVANTVARIAQNCRRAPRGDTVGDDYVNGNGYFAARVNQYGPC